MILVGVVAELLACIWMLGWFYAEGEGTYTPNSNDSITATLVLYCLACRHTSGAAVCHREYYSSSH